MRAGFPSRVRLLRIVKWTSAVMAIVVAVVCVLSFFFEGGYSGTTHGTYVTGGICLHWKEAYTSRWNRHIGYYMMRFSPSPYWRTKDYLVPRVSIVDSWSRDIRLPLYIPIAVFSASWLACSRLEQRAQRRLTNACAKCGYDRSGLARASVCPECGQSPNA